MRNVKAWSRKRKSEQIPVSENDHIPHKKRRREVFAMRRR